MNNLRKDITQFKVIDEITQCSASPIFYSRFQALKEAQLLNNEWGGKRFVVVQVR